MIHRKTCVLSVNPREEQKKKINKKLELPIPISDLSPLLGPTPNPIPAPSLCLWAPAHPRCRLSQPHRCLGHQGPDPQATAQDAPPLPRV